MRHGQSGLPERGSPPAVLLMACVFAGVGCGRAESPFAPDFGVEETPRPSISEEPPSAEGSAADATDVPHRPGDEAADSSVTLVDDQPKSAPRISRVSVWPLVVIDGVYQPEDWHLSDIETLDIDHVEVVKGAFAMRLYGPRARNGVVDIRTKRGS